MREWERTDGKIKILRNYGAEIACDDPKYTKDRDCYLVEFMDEKGQVVETILKKSSFDNFPHKVAVGCYFGIVLFTDGGDRKSQVGIWPIPLFWSKELRERYVLEMKQRDSEHV